MFLFCKAETEMNVSFSLFAVSRKVSAISCGCSWGDHVSTGVQTRDLVTRAQTLCVSRAQFTFFHSNLCKQIDRQTDGQTSKTNKR